jgi:hypothetical protein
VGAFAGDAHMERGAPHEHPARCLKPIPHCITAQETISWSAPA